MSTVDMLVTLECIPYAFNAIHLNTNWIKCCSKHLSVYLAMPQRHTRTDDLSRQYRGVELCAAHRGIFCAPLIYFTS